MMSAAEWAKQMKKDRARRHKPKPIVKVGGYAEPADEAPGKIALCVNVRVVGRTDPRCAVRLVRNLARALKAWLKEYLTS